MSTNGAQGKVISPSKLAHVVLKTARFDHMKRFYVNFLGGHIVHSNDYLAFITYDDEHHRIALINDPNTTDKDPRNAGLVHIAFTFDTLKDLCESYKGRKGLGITPGWCVNHGPTTSMYYQDPDGNQIETQVDNFENPDDATAMMESEAFAENALGEDFDPEDLCAAVERGEDEQKLKTRGNVGPRGAEEIPRLMAKVAEGKVGA